MKLFINDKPLTIVRDGKLNLPLSTFDQLVDAHKDGVHLAKWQGEILLRFPTADQIFNLMEQLKARNYKKVEAITVVVNDPESASHYLKKRFTVVKAAGGLVEKDGKILMIYRLKKWDLPKGKLEKGELPIEGAQREVEEECNIKVEVIEKIGSTWHTYMRNGKHTLKKTYWYKMKSIDDSQLAPQLEEAITDVRWMEHYDWKNALYNSYATIRQVFSKYAQLEKDKLSQASSL